MQYIIIQTSAMRHRVAQVNRGRANASVYTNGAVKTSDPDGIVPVYKSLYVTAPVRFAIAMEIYMYLHTGTKIPDHLQQHMTREF